MLSTNVKMELTVGTGTEGMGALPADVGTVVLKGVFDRCVPEEAMREGERYGGVLLATVADEVSCVRVLAGGISIVEVSLGGAEVLDTKDSLAIELRVVAIYVLSAGVVDSDGE